jgi:very-short-patch-repair endonuclease
MVRYDEEWRKGLSESLKKVPHTKEWNEKVARSLTGRHHSEESKRKMSISQKGHKVSDKTRKKMSISGKGKHSKGHAQSEETKRKISIANKGASNPMFGVKMSQISRNRMRIAHTGVPLLEHHRQAIKKSRSSELFLDRVREARSKQVFPLKDTSIEIKVQEWLDVCKVPYIKHKVFKIGKFYHQVDMFVPSSNIAIECDGKYWHSLPGAKEKDKRIDEILKDQNVQVIRLSEDEINSDSFGEILDVLLIR